MARDEDRSARLIELRRHLSDAEARLGRLYQAIESGVADPTLKERIAAVRGERDIARALDRAVAEAPPEARITPEKITVAVEVMRSNVLNGEIPFRRAYIRSVIDRVDVDDAEIRISGRKTVLERLVMGGGHAPPGVPSLVSEVAHPPRFERGTSTFGGWRSIQLSYGCMPCCLRGAYVGFLRVRSLLAPISQVLIFQAPFDLLSCANRLDTCLRRADRQGHNFVVTV